MNAGEVFLAATDEATRVLVSPAVAARWNEPSALAEMSVSALAGHLVRAVTSVVAYLDRPAPTEAPALDAPDYFLSIEGLGDDIDHDLHRAIRARSAEEASGGVEALVTRWRSGLDDLRAKLDSEPGDRPVAALGGRVMTLEEYLVTRLVELVAHTDDLTASVGLPPPTFDEAATTMVVTCLFEMARRSHGDLAVLRAMIRRERDSMEALRVF